MFLGNGLERYWSGFKNVPTQIEFLIWIVRERSYLSCLVLETTIPPFILMVVNVVLYLILRDY